MLRPLITIDEEKCTGCGQCILDCAEGALAIVDGKAKLISETYCDGLGACLNCPEGALKLEMREAAPFDEEAALKAKASRTVAPKAPTAQGCAGSRARFLRPLEKAASASGLSQASQAGLQAKLPSWPLQLALVPPDAPYLAKADLLLAAHCAGFALPNLHQDWLCGRIPLIACPKLEDQAMLIARLAAILKAQPIASLTVLRMSVPCCGGLTRIAEQALAQSGAKIPLQSQIVSLA